MRGVARFERFLSSAQPFCDVLSGIVIIVCSERFERCLAFGCVGTPPLRQVYPRGLRPAGGPGPRHRGQHRHELAGLRAGPAERERVPRRSSCRIRGGPRVLTGNPYLACLKMLQLYTLNVQVPQILRHEK